MNANLKKLSLFVAGLCVFSVFIFSTSRYADIPLIPISVVKTKVTLNKLPDLSKINDIKEKKKQFFNALYPLVKEENIHVIRLREIIGLYQKLPTEKLSNKHKEWINKVATHYKVTGEYGEVNFFVDLLERVDAIPPSLALAQAAIESGWGTSRFARIGNNIFGQWCFSEGCGIVPSSRDLNKTHEVAKFTNVNRAVRAYIYNLNTNSSYVMLRVKRAQLRENKEEVTGRLLAKTLNKYSEEGDVYIKKVSQFISHNKLQNYTKEFNKSLLLE
jgi:Bax protein